MVKKVVVSHSGKQYVHQLLYALQRKGYLQLFITSIWYKPNVWTYKLLLAIPILGKILLNKFLRKKTYPFQQEELIEQYPWKEFWRQVFVQFSTKYRTEKYVFDVEKSHDLYVAKRLKSLKPDIFIGYEKSSLESFKEIKRQGGITVLDLAQVHYNFLIELRESQTTFQDIFEDEQLFDQINKIKAYEYQYADHILTLSEFAKSTLLKYGVEEQKIRVVSLGYNPQIFKPKQQYQIFTTPRLKLVYSGTFTKRKGVHLLLKAVKELNLPGLELTMIGPVLDGEELFDQYKGLFTYYDFLHHEDMVRHFYDADLYIFPSYLDSWAMTVIEAMACGLPVIVTENTGAKDAVEDGVSGFVIPINDKEALKEKILFFYKQPNQLALFGKRAAEAARKYQWEYYYNQISTFVELLPKTGNK